MGVIGWHDQKVKLAQMLESLNGEGLVHDLIKECVRKQHVTKFPKLFGDAFESYFWLHEYYVQPYVQVMLE